MLPSLLVLVILVAAAPVSPTKRCSIPELAQSDDYLWRVARIAEMVDSASQILWVKAIRADSLAKTVTFLPVEWLRRGTVAPDTLILPGRIVEHDDFNANPVPYQTVRAAGQRGDCFAQEYRLGAQYLLLLTDHPRPHTIYWWPLAPVNEQVRGKDDPWLRWVRKRVGKGEPSRDT